jgi:hypothetical protein
MLTARPLLALFLAAIGVSATAAPPDATQPLDQVTVEAHRQQLEERVTAFVSKLAHPDFDRSLRRWLVPVCPLVAGLPQVQGEFMLARLSEVARQAGVPLAGEKCSPNLHIVATADPSGLLKSWRRRDRRLGDAMPAEVQHFLTHTHPVMVWYNAAVTEDGGGALDPTATKLGTNYIPTNHHPKGSRIQFGAVEMFESVIVIVDLRRVQELSYGQLADYVAMLGFAQLDPDADFGSAPSILQLFGARPAQPPPGSLSDWDVAYLRALYKTEQASRTQRNQIIQMMVRDMVP